MALHHRIRVSEPSLDMMSSNTRSFIKIAIFGPTGTIGCQLVPLALRKRHTVTAFVRRPQKLDFQHDGLRVVAGDVDNSVGVAVAVQGQDTVLPPEQGMSAMRLINLDIINPGFVALFISTPVL